MKDYYKEFIVKNSENILASEVSKVSKPSFDTFDTQNLSVNQLHLSLDDLLQDVELREQFEFEVEERTAFLILDAEISDFEAVRTAREQVKRIWTNLFIQ